MSKYINAGWLYGTLCNLWDKTDSEDFEKGVFETIINAPTADVVEVVRCKDCKHYDEWLVCPLNTFEKFNGTGFCNRGERRE